MSLNEIIIISYPELEEKEKDKDKENNEEKKVPEKKENNDEEKIKWTYGLRLFQIFTKAKDEDLKGELNSIHPTKLIEKTNFKIHYFDIQDKYWPAISNIIRHCKGILFAIQIDDYDEDKGLEFVREWMINLEEIYFDEKDKKSDREDFKKVLIGVFKDENKVLKETRDKIVDYCQYKNMKFYWGKIGDNTDSGEINEAFEGLFELVDKNYKKEDNKNNEDDDDEYDEKLKMYLNY